MYHHKWGNIKCQKVHRQNPEEKKHIPYVEDAETIHFMFKKGNVLPVDLANQKKLGHIIGQRIEFKKKYKVLFIMNIHLFLN